MALIISNLVVTAMHTIFVCFAEVFLLQSVGISSYVSDEFIRAFECITLYSVEIR
jgi:hypothetical protein